MPYSWNIAQLLVKLESAEGTAETLAAADAKILCRDVTYDPDFPFHFRNVHAATAGDFKGASGGPRVGRLQFTVPLAGSGTAGTAPAHGLLFQAGCFGVTNVPGTSDTYKPITTGVSVTIAVNAGGMEFKLHGAKVENISLDLTVGAPPAAVFDVLGVYNEPAAVAAVAPTFESTTPTSIIGGAVTLDSLAMKFTKIGIEIKNSVSIRPGPGLTPGAHSIHVAPGIPHITGSIDPEMEIPATYNFFSKLNSNSTGALSLVINGGTGSVITVTAPAVQYAGPPKPERREHTVILSCPLLFCRSSGGDALSIAYT